MGTVKSRVSRARKALVEILEANEASYSSDSDIQANEAFDDLMEQVADITKAK